jgi:dihydropteroate synthase
MMVMKKKESAKLALFGGRALSFDRTRLMGVINVTDDSFYPASRSRGAADALERAIAMARGGADVIDIGAESTRPGAAQVSADDELSALIPVIDAVRDALPTMPVSVDTRHAEVADECLRHGADIINDVSGLELPQEAERMARLVASSGAVYVLTHTRGTPDVMQLSPSYDDFLPEVMDFLASKIALLQKYGVDRERIIVDPGIGFGKRRRDNLDIIANLERFGEFGLPVLIAASRKGFLGQAAPPDGPEDRLEGTIAVSALCAYHGIELVRVHDVRENRRAVDLIDAAMGRSDV